MRLLLIDDSAQIRAALKRLFSLSSGIKVVGEAADAGTALSLIEILEPDVIISDFNLEHSTALDILRELRSSSQNPVVIVLTNSYSPEIEIACRKAGADFFLDKSHQFGDLIPILEERGSGQKSQTRPYR